MAEHTLDAPTPRALEDRALDDIAVRAWRPPSRLVALLRHRSAVAGLVILGTVLVAALVAPLVGQGTTAFDIFHQDLAQAFNPPSAEHLLGTDYAGRDLLGRLLIGARYTLGLSAAAVAAGLAIGIPMGALSGYIGGWFDLLVQRIVDTMLAFPSFLLALALVAVLGSGLRSIIIAVAATSLPRFVRILRASVLKVKELPYVEAGRVLGTSQTKILVRHVVPNSLAPIVVQASLEMGSAILTASGLGFLGLGVQQPIPEWGAMLGGARDYIFTFPSLVIFPGICVVAVVLAFNLIGDGIRDVLDPKSGTS